MAQACGHDMHRHTGKQQGRGVKMPQIMQPGAREQLASVGSPGEPVASITPGRLWPTR